jgi:hypothetical protein
MICDVCEQHEEDTNQEIEYTRFGTWECDGPGSCYEQSLRLEYGEDKYPFGGGTKELV